MPWSTGAEILLRPSLAVFAPHGLGPAATALQSPEILAIHYVETRSGSIPMRYFCLLPMLMASNIR
jgi:hypothetical protein